MFGSATSFYIDKRKIPSIPEEYEYPRQAPLPPKPITNPFRDPKHLCLQKAKQRHRISTPVATPTSSTSNGFERSVLSGLQNINLQAPEPVHSAPRKATLPTSNKFIPEALRLDHPPSPRPSKRPNLQVYIPAGGKEVDVPKPAYSPPVRFEDVELHDIPTMSGGLNGDLKLKKVESLADIKRPNTRGTGFSGGSGGSGNHGYKRAPSPDPCMFHRNISTFSISSSEDSMAMTCQPTSLLRRLSSANSFSTKLRPRPKHHQAKDIDSKPLRPTSNSNSSTSEQSPALIKGSPPLSAVKQKAPGLGHKGEQGSAAFELTPISALIQQAYTDIATLRNLDEKFYSAASSPCPTPGTLTPKSKSSKGLSRSGSTLSLMRLFGKKDKSAESSRNSTPSGISIEDEERVGTGLGISGAGDEFEGAETSAKRDIDFDAIVRNLERFEELYKTWMKSGALDGEAPPGEVHLVAMVCKEGDVIRGVIDNGVKGAKLPKIKKNFCDCGF